MLSYLLLKENCHEHLERGLHGVRRAGGRQAGLCTPRVTTLDSGTMTALPLQQSSKQHILNLFNLKKRNHIIKLTPRQCSECTVFQGTRGDPIILIAHFNSCLMSLEDNQEQTGTPITVNLKK